MSYQTPPHIGRQQIEIPAGQAFKAGFVAFFGMACAWLIVAIIVTGVMLALGLGGAAMMNGGM